ncbi:MAG TPA: class I SAM-dependent methyltransferase [Puia sp.]|nr:class I SAM-dependent methyltransferase [Puia sp.]
MEQPGIALPGEARQTGFGGKFKMWIAKPREKTTNSWIVEQLKIQPYQHILEVGYGFGERLQEVAKKLNAGFVAGIDKSIHHYAQANRKNMKFIASKLMHIQVGVIEDLSYPAFYFDSIYTGNNYFEWLQPEGKLMQLHAMLKCGGKMLTVVQVPDIKGEEQVWNKAELIQEQYMAAGFSDTRFALREIGQASVIAVTGYKE